MVEISIYTDGASRNNQKQNEAIASWAYAVIFKNVVVREKAKCNHVHTTNNQNELIACIEGLKSINPKINEGLSVTIYSDSKYVTEAFNQKWIQLWVKNNWFKSNKKPVENKDLWLLLLGEIVRLNKLNCPVTFFHVKGHAEDHWNNYVDGLCNDALDTLKY